MNKTTKMFRVFLAAWIAVASAVDGVERARRTSIPPSTQVTHQRVSQNTRGCGCLTVVKTVLKEKKPVFEGDHSRFSLDEYSIIVDGL
jgi:hypothetical protein